MIDRQLILLQDSIKFWIDSGAMSFRWESEQSVGHLFHYGEELLAFFQFSFDEFNFLQFTSIGQVSFEHIQNGRCIEFLPTRCKIFIFSIKQCKNIQRISIIPYWRLSMFNISQIAFHLTNWTGVDFLSESTTFLLSLQTFK